VISLLCSFTMFYRLGEGTLKDDAAMYGGIVDRISDHGDWLFLVQADGNRYLAKPPAAFWLAALTRDLFEDGPFRYLLWSCLLAAFAVLMTVLMGRMLFNAEVGFLAGLMLAVHPALIFKRFARFFSLDPHTVVFAMVVFFGVWIVLEGRRGWGWAAVGLGAAGLSLVKPMGGIPFLAGAALLGGILDRDASWRQKLLGPLVALGVCVLIVAPWYAAQHLEYGGRYWRQIIGKNMVERMSGGLEEHNEPWWFYWRTIPASSIPFALCWPALGMGAALAVRGPRRRAWIFLVALTLAVVCALSASSAKKLRYAYPVFPLIAITIVACIWWGLARLLRASPDSVRRWLAVALILLAVVAASGRAYALCTRKLPRYLSSIVYLPWWFNAFTEKHQLHDASFISVGFPQRATHETRYYFERMRHRVEPLAAERLGAALERPGPLIVILPRQKDSLAAARQAREAGLAVYEGRREYVCVRELGSPLPFYVERLRVEPAHELGSTGGPGPDSMPP